MRYYVIFFFAISLFTIPWLMVNYPNQTDYFYSIGKHIEDELAAVILARQPKSVEEIQARFTPQSASKVRILLVPGHESDDGGAEFGNLKEREMVVELATYLTEFLNANGRYEVIITRDNHGWSPIFRDYFKNAWDSIILWQKEAKKETEYLTSVGQMKKTVAIVQHNDAPSGVAYRLYGITKWANENDIDIAIHIHFNDDARSNRRVPGKYSGFAIYVPERQFGNSTTTQTIASNVFKRLARYNPTSDLPVESGGFIEEPDLIAVGANNTAAAASMLIEYGYIYEQQFTNPEVRSLAIRDLAFQTYLGLQDFFGSGNNVTRAYDTLTLPRTFNREISKSGFRPEDVFALQTALILEGVYPPKNKDKNDCPRTGSFGLCTQTSLESFQKRHNIYDEVGVVGKKTQGILNKLYSVN